MTARSHRTASHSFVFVDTDEALAHFMEEWLPAIEGQPLALDTEEDREFRYAPRIALLQVTREGHDAVIDPLNIDPQHLASAVEALCMYPSRVVLHGGNNDIAGLKRDFSVGPARTADTQIAARFLGERRFGLAALLESRFDVRLDKSVRRTDWGRRPLTDQQIRYARADTTNLLALWSELEELACAAGWEDALQEECAHLGDLPAEALPFDPSGWLRIRGAGGLQGAERDRASSLFAWRDATGRALNMNPSRVLAPWALLALAERGASALPTVRRSGGVHAAAVEQDKDGLKDALRSPSPADESGRTRMRGGRSADRQKIASSVDSLLAWRQSEAERLGLEEGFLAPRQVLETIARACPCSVDELRPLEEIRAWRIRRFGETWVHTLESSE